MEPRILLTAATSLLSPHALRGVVQDVKANMSTLARSGDTNQASHQLTELSSKIPSGPEGLAPLWQKDLGLYDPRAMGSIAAARRRILGDLNHFVRHGGDNPPVTDSGSTTSPPAAKGPSGGGGHVATPSLDSVSIRNTTGLALLVTVHLDVPQVQKPWITETIPAEGNTTLAFDFGTATDAFITVDIRRADGLQSPPPFTDFSLPRPMDGYNGASFTISVFGSFFDVTPG
jgi:hypothetical protein